MLLAIQSVQGHVVLSDHDPFSHKLSLSSVQVKPKTKLMTAITDMSLTIQNSTFPFFPCPDVTIVVTVLMN